MNKFVLEYINKKNNEKTVKCFETENDYYYVKTNFDSALKHAEENNKQKFTFYDNVLSVEDFNSTFSYTSNQLKIMSLDEWHKQQLPDYELESKIKTIIQNFTYTDCFKSDDEDIKYIPGYAFDDLVEALKETIKQETNNEQI